MTSMWRTRALGTSTHACRIQHHAWVRGVPYALKALEGVPYAFKLSGQGTEFPCESLLSLPGEQKLTACAKRTAQTVRECARRYAS